MMITFDNSNEAFVVRLQLPWKQLLAKNIKIGDSITIGSRSYLLRGVIGKISNGKIAYRLILV